jgi:hypothetical protein
MEFLEMVDKELKKPLELTALGGTAMTLLKLKDSTMDIDLNVDGKEFRDFKKILERLGHGYKIDLYADGLVFSQQLPGDYTQKRILIKTNYKNIKLYALHPLDIVVTKLGRLNDRDIEDIKTCVRKRKLTKGQINLRAMRVKYVGNEEVYKTNLKYVLKNLC